MTWLMGFFRSAVLLATDVCVPISRLAEIIEKSQKYLQEGGIYGPLMGHVGDGNFHFVIPVDRSNTEEFAKIKAFCSRLASDVISMGYFWIELSKPLYSYD